ncbi:MAG: hypothetical protein V3G42_16515, partial [Oscillospiraceae bacterium]
MVKTKTRQIAAFTAAMLIAFAGFGGTISGTLVNSNTTLVASAANTDATAVEISARRLGLVTPAQKGTLYRNGVLLNEYTWDEIVEGVNTQVTSDCTLVLEFDDGVLTLNAQTGEVISNTRTSGIVHEQLALKASDFQKDFYDEIVKFRTAGTKAMNLSVYSTERNPETGEIGKWLTASSGIREVEETDSGKIVNYP